MLKSNQLVVFAMLLMAPTLCAGSDSDVTLGVDQLTSGIPGTGPLTDDEIAAWLNDEANHEVLNVSLPLGMSLGRNQMKGLEANPMTRAKIELGRQLYFDTRLSIDATVSCASCHHPQEGFSRHTATGVGVENQRGGRNSPVSYNRILSDLQFWDGRAASLEDQAVGPIANPIEMGNTHEQCSVAIKAIPGYRMQFEKIFPDSGVTIGNIGKAIATFERAIVTGPSAYDYEAAYERFTKMDPEDLADIEDDDPDLWAEYQHLRTMVASMRMSTSARRGKELFFSKRIACSNCHVGANLADEQYHNLGIGMDAKEPDLGRYTVTGQEKDKGAFKTPTIRNVASSAPYMHDGSLATLEETVEHYNKGGTPNKWLSDKITPLKLTPQEKLDLVEFMRACTGSFPAIETGRLPQSPG